jgi:uncharacterized protein YlxW (UPF0749 family)
VGLCPLGPYSVFATEKSKKLKKENNSLSAKIESQNSEIKAYEEKLKNISIDRKEI